MPLIRATGTGKTIYYSFVELGEVSVMVDMLGVGLNLEIVQTILNVLREKEPSFTNNDFQKRFMVITNNGTVELLPYQREKAIVPLWLDKIHSKLSSILTLSDQN